MADGDGVRGDAVGVQGGGGGGVVRLRNGGGGRGAVGQKNRTRAAVARLGCSGTPKGRGGLCG